MDCEWPQPQWVRMSLYSHHPDTPQLALVSFHGSETVLMLENEGTVTAS